MTDEDLNQQLRDLQAEVLALRSQLVAVTEGRALMWLTLANIRNGVYRFKDIPDIVRKVIGDEEDPRDGTPERQAMEHRREMAVGRAAWREAAMQATRDADLMALIVGILELKDDSITNVAPLTLPQEAWTEIQAAVERSRERTSGG